jgi:hypothetical protein
MADRLPSADPLPKLEDVTWGVAILANPVWEAHRQYIVNGYWLPAVRAFYGCPPNTRPMPGFAVHRFFVASVRIREFQETIHVTRQSKGSIAVNQWCNIALNEEDKEAIATWEITIAEVLDVFSAMIFDGYRLSVTWDDYSKALQASLVCANEEDGNYACGMSARHPDMDTVLKTLLYKHHLTKDTGWRDTSLRATGPSWS